MFLFAIFLSVLSPETLFHSLDPLSVQQHLALSELYPESKAAKMANERVAKLLSITTPELLHSCINPFHCPKELSLELIGEIEESCTHLFNRQLKGYTVSSEEEILALEPHEIDLGKAMILSQYGNGPEAIMRARNYSALLDLMALQILAKLPKEAHPRQLIETINTFVFETLHYRFPPESLQVEKIDHFTFLASVMDNHLGVCLGVSTLYLALAQRLGLELEAMTPPGHIYLSYKDQEGKVNIETTARGIDLPEEHYLTIHTHRLHPRTLKEVVGMSYVNEGSGFLHRKEYEKAIGSYEKALRYLERDPLTSELLAYCYLFCKREDEALSLLKVVVETPIATDSTKKHKMAEDILNKKVDLKGIAAVLQEVNESRESILSKKRALLEVINQFPEFREGLFQMAVACLMLNQTKEAIVHLERLAKIDKNDPEIFYYLTLLHGQRKDYKSAWQFFKETRALLSLYPFVPKRALQELELELALLSPE